MRSCRLLDTQWQAAGWAVQDGGALDLFAGQGVAVREVVMAPGHGRVDYLLYVDKRVVTFPARAPRRPDARKEMLASASSGS